MKKILVILAILTTMISIDVLWGSSVYCNEKKIEKTETAEVVTTNDQENTENKLKIHYYRWNNDYDDHGVWHWGDTLNQPKSWAKDAITFAGKDEFGVCYTVELGKNAKSLGFLIVKKSDGHKDGKDRVIADLAKVKEVWVIQGIEETFTVKPDKEKYQQTEQNILYRTGDYVELDQTSVKLMFRAAKDATVSILYGENSDKLNVVKKFEKYNDENYQLKQLDPQKEHYYKIVAVKNGKLEESPVIKIEQVAHTIPTTLPAAAWAESSIFYQIFIRSFYDGNNDGIGDLKGIEMKLDYLKKLGINALWLTPVYPSPSYHGYNVSDYFGVNPDFGTMKDFQSLVKKAHQKGIKVVIDFVVNHTSKEHPWFQGFINGDKNYQDFYRYEYSKIDGSWGEVGAKGSGVFCYYAFGPQSDMPDLNYNNPEVRKSVKNVAKFWLDQGIDGFRLDVAQYIGDADEEFTYRWWKEFSSYVKTQRKDAYVVGEINYDGAEDFKRHAPYYAGMDATFNFPLYNKLLVMSSGLDVGILEMLNQARDSYASYNKGFADAILLGNHDRARFSSELVNLSGGVNFDLKRIKKAIALQMTLPGTPYIYYGDEIGMRGGHDFQGDPHKREPFEWYKSENGKGMTSMVASVYGAEAKNIKANDGISFEEAKSNANSIYNYYRKLIEIRKKNQMMFAGNYERFWLSDEAGKQTYCYKISDQVSDYELYVLHNQNQEQELKVSVISNCIELLNNKGYQAGKTIVLPVFGTAIIKVKRGVVPVEMGTAQLKQEATSCKLVIKVHVPEDTPADAVLYMPNSDDGWNASEVVLNQAQRCKKIGDYLYEITIERNSGSRMEYKFFRGSWENSETDADGNWTGNRVTLFTQREAVIDVYIKGWRDIDYQVSQ